MGRSGYIDDEQWPNQFALWQAAVRKSFNGKRGQAFLKELAQRMDAMPDKILIADELVDSDGDCCTIGVVCKARGIDTSQIDYFEPSDVGSAVGISPAMAAEIEFQNDEAGPFEETPEQRWIRMRKWIDGRILKEEPRSESGEGAT
jgi:hypothetical protein